MFPPTPSLAHTPLSLPPSSSIALSISHCSTFFHTLCFPFSLPTLVSHPYQDALAKIKTCQRANEGKIVVIYFQAKHRSFSREFMYTGHIFLRRRGERNFRKPSLVERLVQPAVPFLLFTHELCSHSSGRLYTFPSCVCLNLFGFDLIKLDLLGCGSVRLR